MTATIGELCAGYGGLGMGVSRVIDSRVAWVSEIDKGALKVLEHRFPGVPNIGDMTTVDWASVPAVDILTGGTPCQDLSHAGKRAGMTEGTRSNLWVAMREAIATIRPSLVVWENVSGAYSAEADSDLGSDPRLLADTRRRDGEPVLRALGRVLGDLASLGYVGGWHGLRAADVGSCHPRLRVFVVAYPNLEGRGSLRWVDTFRRDTDGCRGADRLRATEESATRVRFCGQVAEHGAHWYQRGRRPCYCYGHDQHGHRHSHVKPLLPSPRTSDTNGAGQHGDGGLDLRTAVTMLPTPRATDGTKGGPNQRGSSGDLMLPSAVTLLPTPSVAGGHLTRSGARSDELLLPGVAAKLLPTPMVGSSSEAAHGQISGQYRAQMAEAFDRWGDYAEAIHRWETVTRPAPEPTMLSRKGTPQLSPAFSEWMMGLPAGWVTDVPGITRNEALRALGNGVVPQQASAAVSFLLDVLSERVAA